MLVQAAMALWRTKGYSHTTVAEICTAAGVSKALFYFYFPRKEDVLFEVGVMSTRTAHRTIHALLDGDYEIDAVIAAALRSFETSMARNPRELIVETILEGYRHEHRLLAEGVRLGQDTDMFSELFTRAASDGKLGTATDADVTHLAYLAQTMAAKAHGTGPRALSEHARSPMSSPRTSSRSSTATRAVVRPRPPPRRHRVGLRDRPRVPGTAGLGR